jgi:hypothetical protein
MSEWTSDELSAINDAEEVEVTPADADGAPLQTVVMWAVTVGDEVFVRSVHGTKARWFRRATATARGTFTTGSVTREVAFEPVGDVENQSVTEAYSRKYAAQPDEFLAPMVSGVSLEATLRVVPV